MSPSNQYSLISYEACEYKNLLCQYVTALYATAPSGLALQLDAMHEYFCNPTCPSPEDPPVPPPSGAPSPFPRIPWGSGDVDKIVQDIWFAWDMDNCQLRPQIIQDVFGNNAPLVEEINPVVPADGFDDGQQALLKKISGFHHYFFARTYYIDRCVGTQKYLIHEHENSLTKFLVAHEFDFDNFVDDTNLIKGQKLLENWQQKPAFRQLIQDDDVLGFVKPCRGLLCEEVFQWNVAQPWWTENLTEIFPWIDDARIASSVNFNQLFDANGNPLNFDQTIDINESKLVTAGNIAYPVMRVSANDLYLNIDTPESDDLSSTFGNNLIKGPTNIQNIPTPYPSNTCTIPKAIEEIDIIKNIELDELTDEIKFTKDTVKVFDVMSYITETVALLESCDSTGTLLPVSSGLYSEVPGLSSLPCTDEIEVITDIFIEDMNLRITKKRLKVISINNPVNETSIITSISSCPHLFPQSSYYKTSGNNWTASANDPSVYNDSEIVTVTGVTDIYISGGSLVQKKNDMKVIRRTSQDNVSVLASVESCD